MRVVLAGVVVDCEVRSFTRTDGTTSHVFDAWLQSSNPRYAPERISGPADLAPSVGEDIAYRAVIAAKAGKHGPWVSTWCVERLPQAVADALAESVAVSA